MSNPEDKVASGFEKGMYCLECGATIPADMSRCPECGNEKLILPARWNPPGDDKPRPGLFGLGDEVKVLIGLSLALICGLCLLGTSRASNDVRLNRDGISNPGIVSTDFNSAAIQAGIEEITVDPQPNTIEPDIVGLRLVAYQAQSVGAWPDAVSGWTDVIRQPDAVLEDFLSLAAALIEVDDSEMARETLRRVCVRFPDRPEGYLALGSLHERLGNLNASRFQYQVGLSYCRDNTDLGDSLRRVEETLGLEEAPSTEIELEAIPEEDIESQTIEPEPSIEEPEPDEIELEPTPEPDLGPRIIELDPPIDETTDSHVESLDGETSETGVDNLPPPENESVVIIGTEPDDENEGHLEDQDGDEIAQEEVDNNDSASVISIRDLQVTTTEDQVTVKLMIDSPAAISTSCSTDPPKLVVRIDNAEFLEGTDLPGSITLDTPLVEQVDLYESSADNINEVILVIYLGLETRHFISADGQSIRVSIGKAPGMEAG